MHGPSSRPTNRSPMRVTQLLLADGRLPAGAYAHSLGLEEAVASGRVADAEDVVAYCRGALATVGVVSAALVLAAWDLGDQAGGAVPWMRLDAEADARTASPAQRRASRQLGRHLRRLATAFGPGAVEAVDTAGAGHPDGPHQPLALGSLTRSLGMAPEDAAMLSLYGTVTGIVHAAVRLLGIDPNTAIRSIADHGAWIEDLAVNLTTQRPIEPVDLPASAAPLLDHLIERHSQREGRLFAT